MGAPLLASCAAAALAGSAAAQTASPGQPFTNIQPSLALTELTPFTGIFPSAGSGPAASDTLAFIYDFAGNYAPFGTRYANGQALPIAQNPAEFGLFGTTYGGDGRVLFNLPNLTGQATIGAGAYALGAAMGSPKVSLTAAQLPPPVGAGQPFSNLQPSLPLTPLIAVNAGAPGSSAAFLGEIAYYAGAGPIPAGWAVANGSVLSISSDNALFNVIGAQYGGNGQTTFALPNLVGRVAVGATAGEPVGAQFGEASTILTSSQLPPTSAPVGNDQRSLSVE
jgi:microcystin-dependent protein